MNLSRRTVISILLVILAGGGVGCFLYLRKSNQDEIPSFSDDDDGLRREGGRLLGEVNGEERLLTIEGVVEEISPEEKVITLRFGDALEQVQYTDSDVVYLMIDSSFATEEALLSDIQVGDHVTYNPVDESVNRHQAAWMIHWRK